MSESGLPAAGRRRRLGQNFLADPNLLEAIVREAAPQPDDVVLEVGGGEGALSEVLAPRVAALHVVELDERLREALSGVAASHSNVRVHWGDALRLDLGQLEPAPSAVVSNLPYSIATPLIIRTIVELASVGRWTVMVQREIADRLRAEPGSSGYGAPSAIVQLACRIEMLRTVDRAVFVPRPRVDSAVIRLIRIGPGPDDWEHRVVRAAFAHRRKGLARSLEHAMTGVPAVRERARDALVALGRRPGSRAQELEPAELLELARALRGEDG